MNSFLKILIIVAVLIFATIGIKMVYFHQYVYYNEDFRQEICEDTQSDIIHIDVVIRKIDNNYARNKVRINSAEILTSLKEALGRVCSTPYSKNLYARYSNDVFKCKMEYKDGSLIYLKVVKFDSGKAYIEFHKGGLFSLIGSISDEYGFASLLKRHIKRKI